MPDLTASDTRTRRLGPLTITLLPRRWRQRFMRRRLVEWVARWQPAPAALIVLTVGLVVHEIAYALAGGDEYPLVVLADHTRVFVLSHGGLDALGVGALLVATLALIDLARNRQRGTS